jgi:hypothetical protein
VSCLVSHEENVTFYPAVGGGAGHRRGAGMWKVRQLADSKLLIKEETIFTLEAGTGRWRWATAVSR